MSLPPPSLPRILIVEDVPAIAEAASAHLRAGGFEVHVAQNGATALAVAGQVRPDLVLSDIMMPLVDGIEFLRRAKSIEALRGVPILMLSAVNERDRVTQCLLLGAVDFVPKPFDPVVLLRKVRKHLKPRDASGAPVTQVFNATAPIATGARPMALVAAATPEVIDALRGALQESYSVHLVADGAAALDAAATHLPKVVIAESRLAVFDGVEVLAKVRATPATAGAFLALVAARTDVDAARRARDVAGVEILAKPLEARAVASFVATASGKKVPAAPKPASASLDTASAGAAAAGEDVHFDPAALEPFRELPPSGDGVVPVDQIVDAYLLDAPQRIEALKSALQSGDAKALGEAAHALKGGSGSVGAKAIESLCRELETAAKGGADAAAGQADSLPRIEESLARYREAFANWRQASG